MSCNSLGSPFFAVIGQFKSRHYRGAAGFGKPDGVAKVIAKTDGKVRELVDPLASVFATNRTRKPTEPK